MNPEACDVPDNLPVQKDKITHLPKLPKSAPKVQLPSLTVAPGQTIQFLLKLTLPPDSKLNEEAPSSWFITAEGKVPVMFYRPKRSKQDTKWVIL